MAEFNTEYVMQEWLDHLKNIDGEILQQGSPYNRLRMMYIEQGIHDAHAAVVTLSLWLADKYAAIGHTHEGIYSPIIHNHDTAYAAKTHDHDGVYATASHNHSGVYEPVISKKSGFNLDKSDGVTSTSSTTIATSKAAKVAYDKGVEALNEANTKLDATYGDPITRTASTTITATYTDMVVHVSSSSNTIQTLPANTHPAGTQIPFTRLGTGEVTIAAGSGLSIRQTERQINEQNDMVVAVFISTNDVLLVGPRK